MIVKKYLDQIYNEGLATTFYLKPVKFISKYIKNKLLLKIFKIMIGFLYTIFVLMLAWFIFWDRYPL